MHGDRQELGESHGLLAVGQFIDRDQVNAQRLLGLLHAPSAQDPPLVLA